MVENKKETKCYKVWHSMLARCYDMKYHEKRPSYINCEICKEWHNFQNFAEWFYDNYYEIEGETMSLDKDILFKRNKIYSPKTCVFVPKKINSLFVKSNKNRGSLPIGVSYHKRDGVFTSHSANGNGKNIHLGNYNSLQDAFESYRKYKEKIIKQVANEYKDLIPYKLYKAMYRYKVEIDD